MRNVTDIILEGQRNGKTLAEINEDLKAAGSGLYLGADKSGNAVLLCGAAPEPVTVEDGQLVNGAAGIPHQDEVLYNGRVWQLDDDQVTLVPPQGEETPWWASMHTFAGAVAWQEELDKYVPEQDMMHRPKYAGQTVIKGALRYTYDADGNAKYQPKSMGDYDRDHGRL